MVRLNFDRDQVTVRSGGGDTGRGNQTVPCQLDGEPVEIAFQAAYVIDALNGCGDTAVIGMVAPSKPALYASEDGTYRNLTMALRSA
jgi:DNA polymerase-3 subunit beta